MTTPQPSNQLPEEVKRCSACGESKPLGLFYKEKRQEGQGVSGACKPCTLKRRKELTTQRSVELNRIRVHRYRNKLGREKTLALGRENYRKNGHSKRRDTPQERARWMLRNAVSRGSIVRPIVCEKCCLEARVQGHHDDYSKPLEVRWLCTKCHGLEHRKPFTAL